MLKRMALTWRYIKGERVGERWAAMAWETREVMAWETRVMTRMGHR